MTTRRYLVAAGATLGLVLGIGVAGPAEASQGGVYLKTGDTVCTDQSRSDTCVLNSTQGRVTASFELSPA